MSEYLATGGIKEFLPTLQAAAMIASDPYLPEVTCHVMRLNAISKGLKPGPSCPRTVTTVAKLRKGIGLKTASKPLRAFVWIRGNPAIAATAVVGAIWLIWQLGYNSGEKQR